LGITALNFLIDYIRIMRLPERVAVFYYKTSGKRHRKNSG